MGLIMKKLFAFKADHDSQRFHATAKSAREAEFDHLVHKITQHVSGGIAGSWQDCMRQLAQCLRDGVYPSGADAFIEAAEYLKKYRMVMMGKECDPEEVS